MPIAFIVARTRIEEAKLTERFGDEYRKLHGENGAIPAAIVAESVPRLGAGRVSDI